MPRRPSTSLKKRFSDFLASGLGLGLGSAFALAVDGCVGTTAVAECRCTRWCAGAGILAVRDVRGSCLLAVWAVALVGPGRYLTVGSSQYLVMKKSSRFHQCGRNRRQARIDC